MRRRVTWLAILLLLSTSCDGGPGLPEGWQPEGPIECRAELSAKSVGLMQPVKLTVWAYFELERMPSLTAPPIPEGFEGHVETRADRHGSGWIARRVFHLRPTELGMLEIPSMKVSDGTNRTTTPRFELEVTSVLGDGHDPREVEDPAAPFPPLLKLWPFLVGAAAVALLLLLVWWLRRRARRPKSLSVEVALPAHINALRALERLQQAPRQTEAEVEAFYVEVSRILRTYLEERFGLHAPMRSTEEFLVEVEQGDALSLSQRQSLRQFLQQCDLVKFARLFQNDEAHEQTLRIAENFVEQTRGDVERGTPDAAMVGGVA